MNHLKKLLALAMAVCMLCSLGLIGASAAAVPADGAYTADLTMLHDEKDKPSMCNSLFDQDADLTVSGGTAELRIYVAFPVPAFPDGAPDGTVKNVTMTLDGKTYTAESDITSLPQREFDENGPMFGVSAGQKLSTQVLTFSGIPAEKLELLAEGVPASAFVNVIMKKDVAFRLQLTALTAIAPVEPEPTDPVDPEPTAPSVPSEPADPDVTEQSEQSMHITAEVAAAQPTYTVTIPETINLGTLSRTEDNVIPFTVSVAAENLGSGRVVVSAPSEGALVSGENRLPFANSFGTQETSVSVSLSGEFLITAEAVRSAAAGNYTGTADFTISFFAGN